MASRDTHFSSKFKAFRQKNLRILQKQAEPLFRSTLAGGIGNIFAALLALIVLKSSEQDAPVEYLVSLIIITSLARILLSQKYLQHKRHLIQYLRGHALLTFIVGCFWAGIAYCQIYTDNETLRTLVFLLNFGLIAASIATLSTWMPAYLLFMLPQSLAIIYVFSVVQNEYNIQMIVGYFLFAVVMVLTSYRFNRNYKNEIELTLFNEQLINDLNSEISIREKVQLELEQSKQGLEKKIEERTKDLVDMNLHLSSVIDKKERAERDLQYIAYHDELTGLPNKNLLLDRIEQSIKNTSRTNCKLAILFLDLDRFKTINDSLGHTIGDKLLKEVATRLLSTLRKQDTVSRNGGDEFVIVLEQVRDSDEAVKVARKIIDSLTTAFDIMSHRIHIGASIGISIYPNDGDTALILLRNADTAMYRAKKTGGNQFQFYDESMSNQLRDRLELEGELHNALLNNEFYMVYQPQISSSTGVTLGFESLIRWNNRKYGEISPARFVPLLEETGLIYAVGDWIVSEVARFARNYMDRQITFAINLSALQCNEMAFVEHVKNEIAKTGIRASQLEFEITESLLINDFETTREFLTQLHALGCSIALDDFGTGYTAMNYLTRLPIDTIKVDKSLVRGINTNNDLKSIVQAIVKMSASLGMTNVFEGVETVEELGEIRRLDGEIIQGFLFSKPMAAGEVDTWLNQEHSRHVPTLFSVRPN
ncbi:MAG TPA: EAL domain-containing protein [Gammaproteobacteria bacterium]|nr:EAL domain-containing protein [Gammaproteobacteria bacterium]